MVTNTQLILGFGLAVGAVTVGVWAAKGTRGLKGAGLGRSRHRGLGGEHEANDLYLSCDNYGDLYRQQREPIEKNLQRKLAKGVYNHELAKKLWGYLVENCAKKYAKQAGGTVPWHKMFSTSDRREVARKFADRFKQEHRA